AGVAAPGSHLGEREHQVRPVHAPDVWLPQATAEKDKRHAIRRDHPRTVDDAPQRGLLLAHHYRVDRAHDDIRALAAFDPACDLVERLLHVDRADTNTEDVGALRARAGVIHHAAWHRSRNLTPSPVAVAPV